MSKLSVILKALMHEVGITVTELARRTGIGQPVIHRMASGETDNPKVGSLSPIAKFFNVTISQLIGDDPLSKDRFKGSHNPFYRSWTKLPLLSWEQAAYWPRRVYNEVESYVSTESVVSEQAFAVRVEDTTMTPRFPEGTILVFDPDIKPQDKDFVAIHIDGQAKMQFKQMLLDGADLYLKPINPDFQTNRVEKQYRILGVMTQALAEFYQDRRPLIIDEEEEISDAQSKSPVKKRKDHKPVYSDEVA
jgi:SOS-response transcriptional repressor LexA